MNGYFNSEKLVFSGQSGPVYGWKSTKERYLAKYNSKELMGNSINSRAKSGIGYVPEDRQVFPEHTVEENINLGKKNNLKNINNWELEKIWETFPLLKNLRNRLAGQLSGGEQQMLSIARTLAGNPEIL